jgi:hypothetical protein
MQTYRSSATARRSIHPGYGSGGSSIPTLKSLLVASSPNWLHEDTRSCTWLRHYAASQKVVGLILDVIRFFQLT